MKDLLYRSRQPLTTFLCVVMHSRHVESRPIVGILGVSIGALGQQLLRDFCAIEACCIVESSPGAVLLRADISTAASNPLTVSILPYSAAKW